MGTTPARFYVAVLLFHAGDTFAFGLVVDVEQIDFCLINCNESGEGDDPCPATLAPSFRGDGHAYLAQAAEVGTEVGIGPSDRMSLIRFIIRNKWATN